MWNRIKESKITNWILRHLVWVVLFIGAGYYLTSIGFAQLVALCVGLVALAIGLSGFALFAYTKIKFVEEKLDFSAQIIVGIFRSICTLIAGSAIAYYLAQFITSQKPF
jgi:hypothetical protein